MKPGTYVNEMTVDGINGKPMTLKARLTVGKEGIDVEYFDVPPAVSLGLNVPMCYTDAYTAFGIKCIVAPKVPNNYASLATIRVTAPQPERSVLEIVPMIKASRLSDTVKARAIALFRELADVEALQHADEPDNVHFHEVGAVDSILDIVGSVAGLEALGVTTVRVSPLNVGGGLVNSRDGILPVPGPATLELLRRRGIPMYSSEYGPEFLTPTGALVLGCLADSAGPFADACVSLLEDASLRRRLVQKADGFTATVVNGVVTYRNGEHTGALPGRLVRSA